MKKMSLSKTSKKGFTLIELLVVFMIIGVLATLVLATLSNAKSKGQDGAVKSNLKNAITQAEIFYNTNTAVPNTYTDFCTNSGSVGGAQTVALYMAEAAKAAGLASYVLNTTGTASTATCNDSASAWAAEVPLRTSGQMWCIDSTGTSKQETGSSLGASNDYTCM